MKPQSISIINEQMEQQPGIAACDTTPERSRENGTPPFPAVYPIIAHGTGVPLINSIVLHKMQKPISDQVGGGLTNGHLHHRWGGSNTTANQSPTIIQGVVSFVAIDHVKNPSYATTTICIINTSILP